MSALDEARALFEAGRNADAVAAVERGADAGDADAGFVLANWRLFGLNGPRDAAAAHRHLRKAGEKGHVEAIRLRAFLMANGTGTEENPAKARRLIQKIAQRDDYAAMQADVLPRMMSPGAAKRAPRERLSEDPHVELVRGLLLAEECAYVMRLAQPALAPSFVVDPTTGMRTPNPIRTSHGTNFGPHQEDLVLNALNRRLAAATGTRPEWGEPLHVLHYAPGQEYRPHLDALPATQNQRAWTALAYLNDGYAGGETHFPELGITVRGKTGDVLIFRNVDAKGRGDPRTIHAGLPVTQGVKWLATRWIRQGPFDAFSEAAPA